MCILSFLMKFYLGWNGNMKTHRHKRELISVLMLTVCGNKCHWSAALLIPHEIWLFAWCLIPLCSALLVLFVACFF